MSSAMMSIRKDGLMIVFLVRFQLFAMRTMPFHSPLKVSFASFALASEKRELTTSQAQHAE